MGHMDPVKATSDVAIRTEVALRHAKVIDDNFKYTDTCGAIGWCFLDYHSHTDFGSGDKLCTHGVFDLYRNPKYTSYIYASQQEKRPVLELLSNLKPGDVAEGIFSDVYVATNCDYVELYKNDEYVAKFYPKHDQFKYMKHPPILIDDIVGETFKEDKFPKRTHLKIAKMFSYAAMHGFNHLPLKNKIYLGYMMLRYKVSYTELVGYWNKYVGAWGGKAKTYKFKGYINNQLVKEIEAGPSDDFALDVSLSKNELVNEDTYDTLRIKVRHVDSHNSVMQYSQRILDIETSGPIELVGPTHQALLGGQLSIYIKSKNEKGIGKVTITMDEFKKTLEIPVN
jgi:beta-galactosidase